MIYEKFLGPKKRSMYHLSTSLCHVVSDLPICHVVDCAHSHIWMKIVLFEIIEPMEIHDCSKQMLDVISDI